MYVYVLTIVYRKIEKRICGEIYYNTNVTKNKPFIKCRKIQIYKICTENICLSIKILRQSLQTEISKSLTL